MAKDWAKKFYSSKAWQDGREGYIKSKFGICERCERPGDIVHHKEYLTPGNINNPDITLNWDNLELLCQDCHNKEHHGSDEGTVREGLMFNEYGELIRSE